MNDKYSDIIILAVLGIIVVNWNAVYSLANLFVVIAFLLGVMYVIIMSNKQSSHYRVVLGFLMIIEVVPAFLLKGTLIYAVAAIVLIILFVVKQLHDLKQNA